MIAIGLEDDQAVGGTRGSGTENLGNSPLVRFGGDRYVRKTCTTGRGPVAVQTTERTWQLRAACRGPESALFFPPTYPERKDERDAREARAKAICQECPVRSECLEYAISIREPHGIWGGLTEAERRLMFADDAG